MTVTGVQVTPPKPKGLPPEQWAFMVAAYQAGHRDAGAMRAALIAANRSEPSQFGDGVRLEERTIYRHMARLRDFYAGTPAGLGDIPIQYAGVVMAVLEAVIRETAGRVQHFTREEVDWIVRVHAATTGRGSEDPSPWQIYQLAFDYWTLARSGQPTVAMDVSIAYLKPWTETGPSPTDTIGKDGRSWLPVGQYRYVARTHKASGVANPSLDSLSSPLRTAGTAQEGQP